MTNRAGQSGFTRVEALIAVLALAMLLALLFPSFQRERMLANMAACGDNLRAIGNAMSGYAAEYDGTLPVAGGRGTIWGTGLANWSAGDRWGGFGLNLDGSGGQATISSSLYLLVRQMEVDPGAFVCPVDRGARKFRPERYGLRQRKLADLWDFGPASETHCSYAYQMVYTSRKLMTSAEPGFAIAADRNPWMDPPFGKADDFSTFMPDLDSYGGTRIQAQQGNTLAHRRRGENVLFLDMHLDFQQRPYCGFEDDNIYTCSNGKEKSRGVPPKLGSVPANARDSLLVNDPTGPAK